MLWFAVAPPTVVGAPQQAAFPAAPATAPTASITLASVVADAQSGAVIELALAAGGQAVSALQLDISYQSQAMALSVSPGSTLAGAGKSLWTSSPQSGVERILIVGLNQNALPDGVLATLAVQMTNGASPGVYPLELTNAMAANPLGGTLPLSTGSGGVVVPGTGASAPSVTAVYNAASNAAGPVAPGEIVIVTGNFLADSEPNASEITSAGLIATTLSATTVLFDDVPSPLLYTAANQVSAVVPYEVSGQAQTSLQVEYQGVRSAPLIAAVAPTSPAIFTLNGSGAGQAAIVNQDGTTNSPGNPAARGDIVWIFGTGEGQTVPPGTDGIIVTALDLRQPLQGVTVSIGGQNAEVLYAGSAGDQVAGLLQVDVRVPLGITPGAAAPVTFAVGGSSQPGVTMAVR